MSEFLRSALWWLLRASPYEVGFNFSLYSWTVINYLSVESVGSVGGDGSLHSPTPPPKFRCYTFPMETNDFMDGVSVTYLIHHNRIYTEVAKYAWQDPHVIWHIICRFLSLFLIFFDVFILEDEANMIFGSSGNPAPNDTALYPRRLQFTSVFLLSFLQACYKSIGKS